MSYHAGGSWNYVGPWSPAKQTTRVNAFGGAHLALPTVLGPVMADVTLRHAVTQDRVYGNSGEVVIAGQAAGLYLPAAARGRGTPGTNVLLGQAVGIVLNYAPFYWWSHDVGVGQDAEDTELRRTAPGYTRISDTTLVLTQRHNQRRSQHYTMTARIPTASFAQATVTLGGDAWQNLTTVLQTKGTSLTGTLAGPPFVSRQPGHNAGGLFASAAGDDRSSLPDVWSSCRMEPKLRD